MFFLWSGHHYYIPGSLDGRLLRYNGLFLFFQAVYYTLNLAILVFLYRVILSGVEG